MADHRERACLVCGSLLHHEDDCPDSYGPGHHADNFEPFRVATFAHQFQVFTAGCLCEQIDPSDQPCLYCDMLCEGRAECG